MYIGLVRRRLAGGPPKFQEGASSMEPARETAKERGGVPASVRDVLSGSGVCDFNFWGGDPGFVSGSVQEAGESAPGIPQTYDGAEIQAAEGQDPEKNGSGEGNKGSRNLDTGGVH